jgi:acetylornithine/succinyldiaminopimelate/putrescine aminotransferase
VVDFQGLGFLHGLRMNKPAKDIQKQLLARDILAGTAGDPSILRLLPAFILKEEHIDLLRAALIDL